MWKYIVLRHTQLSWLYRTQQCFVNREVLQQIITIIEYQDNIMTIYVGTLHRNEIPAPPNPSHEIICQTVVFVTKFLQIVIRVHLHKLLHPFWHWFQSLSNDCSSLDCPRFWKRFRFDIIIITQNSSEN